MPKSKFLNALLRGFFFPMCLVLGVPGEGGDNENGPGAGQGNDNNAGGNPAGDKPNTPPKTFTQEDLNRIAAKEKSEGRKALLKELGLEDNEDAKKDIKAYLSNKEAQKTELQKAIEKATKAENEKAEANASATNLQRKLDALSAGAKPETVSDLAVLVATKMDDKTDFKAALEAVKKAYPLFFNEDSGNKKHGVGTGGSTNHPKGGDGNTSMGERLAKSRAEQNPKENPFFNKKF